MELIDYAKLTFDDETERLLFDFCRELDLGHAAAYGEPGDFKFHVTVMYSSVTSPHFKEGLVEGFSPLILRPECWDLFGSEGNHLVLRLHLGQELSELYGHYPKTYGHVSDFAPYRPHVTIAGGETSDRRRLAKIPVPSFALRADKLVHKVKLGRGSRNTVETR